VAGGLRARPAGECTAFTEALSLAEGFDRARILASRAFAYFDSFQHYEAFVDASSALAIEPANIRALNARMVVLKESGDLKRALDDMDALLAALTAQGTSNPLFAQQREMVVQKLNSLETLTPVRRWEGILVFATKFADAKISDFPRWISARFESVHLHPEFVKAAAEALLARERDRAGPVRFLDDIPKLHVIGNLIGDVSALYKIFDENGFPTAANPYLIDGNLTGELSSVDVVVLLVVAKAVDDRAVHFNQGPADTAKLLRLNGFEGEAAGEFGDASSLLVRILTEAPVVTIVNRRYCVLNGGLPGASPSRTWRPTPSGASPRMPRASAATRARCTTRSART
jgi:hypothetical protein